MAIIKCTECGHEVSNRASACPNCGCPIEKGKCCVECGQPIPEGVNVCPNCGCPTQDNLSHDFESSKKSKSRLIWLISIMVFAFLLGGGYYFYNKTVNYAHSEHKAQLNISKESNDNENKFTEETVREENNIEQKAVSEDSFTTSKGTFSKERAIQMWYEKGVEHGTSDKNLPYPRKYFNGDGTESRFKTLWVAWFGAPDNDITKEIYNIAIEKYKQGYEVGWNF